jgi:hypothetical protein
LGQVAITIRNKTTEDLIRKISRRTGEGPSAVIGRLVRKEALGHEDTLPEEEVQRRLRRFEELAQMYPPPDPRPSREEIEREVDALYDDLEKERPSHQERGRE